jgi:hypothetical protein
MQPIFKVLDNKTTGLNFTNKLTPSDSFNMFNYMYFYNGAGVGAGDFNNDGLTDLFFSSNQGQNKIYINGGNFRFKDVTAEAQIPQDGGWSTGVSVVDINNDGLLDIYVCRVGNFETLHSKNQLLICKGVSKSGVPFFRDEAKAYGLDFSGFSTQAAFFDYDMDGDLDMFLMNHSVHQNGNYAPRATYKNMYDPLSGDRIYRNEGNDKFVDVTKESGINSSAIGYGLGVALSDIDLDGWPDLYIGNDFHENDYLYINQRNGVFRDELNDRIMHTSKFSMGVDVGDINNDAYPDIISMDMLAADPAVLKRSLGGDEYDIYKMKIGYGYNDQYSRNNLQLNRRNSMFSEVGLFSGVANTDWSWAPLWMDFDNDGLKDLFVSNGIPKRMNDIDYINFVTSGDIQQMIRNNNMQAKDFTLIDKFPENKLRNKFYHNNGDLTFTDEGEKVQDDELTFSNGAVYVDVDNDGDLDIVVNNINAPVMVYENKLNAANSSSFTLLLKGDKKNVNAIGAKVIVYTGGQVQTYEKFPVKGFLSSMEIPMLIGTGKHTIDSMLLIWPDNSYQRINAAQKHLIKLQYQKNLPKFNYGQLTNRHNNVTPLMEDITKAVAIDYVHEENHFMEFDREPLIPHMISTEGPALAVADINHDGLDDIFIGSSRGKKAALFIQQLSGKFLRSTQPALDKDSVFENTDACFTDINKDGNVDLVIASGGNEFFGSDYHNTPRIYVNDANGNFAKLENAFDNLFLTASCVVPFDFNGDGYNDLFIGGRCVPWEYGQVPRSYLLQNNKAGKFINVTATHAPEIANAGFVTFAVWFDIDNDGDKDLLVSLEWGGIDAYINNSGNFVKRQLTEKKGWWNFVLPCDIDNDGDIDMVAGNLGLNSRLKATDAEPLRLYFNDFDGNGKKEQILTYYVSGKEIPFATKSELEKQMPVLKKKFLYAGDFAKATLTDLFVPKKLKEATTLTANYLANAIFVNNGNLQFTVNELPAEAQFTSMKDAAVVNANNDNLPDIMIMGNYYDANVEMGRYDADYGTMLINKGNAKFMAESMNGFNMKGQVRHIRSINIDKQQAFVLACNSDSAKVIRFVRKGSANK